MIQIEPHPNQLPSKPIPTKPQFHRRKQEAILKRLILPTNRYLTLPLCYTQTQGLIINDDGHVYPNSSRKCHFQTWNFLLTRPELQTELVRHRPELEQVVDSP
jgi:hypothetical protein